jgi:hypothetical protein
MDKKTKFLIGAVLFLSGIIIGFFISPIKQGIGNNSGNNTTNHYNNEKEEKDEEVIPSH